MPTIGQNIRATKVEHNRMIAAAILKNTKDIMCGKLLIAQKAKKLFATYKSPKGLTYPTWRLFLAGVYGWDEAYANRFMNAVLQQDRLVALKLTSVSQNIDTLWTCRKIDDKMLKAAWLNITKGDLTYLVTDRELHQNICMHESVKERDTREQRVSTRMVESEFVKLIDAVNDRIMIVNKKIIKLKGTKLTKEPTYTFDAVKRQVVSSVGVVYETNEWLMHISDYLFGTNNI